MKPASLDIKAPLVLAIVLVITAFAFLPSLNNGFVNWDDPEYVIYDPLIRNLSLENIGRMFSVHLTGKYNPLVLLSFAVDFRLGQLNPFPYHLTNLILHLLNVTLVFALVRRLWNNLSLALFTSLLFGIHPMQVEAVAWVAARQELLFTVFYLSALLMYLRYLKTDKTERGAYYWTAGLFLLALFSKVTAMTLPLVLLLLDYHGKGKITREDWFEKIPFCFFGAAFAVPTWLATHSNAFSGTILYGYFDRFLLSCYALWVYLVNLIVPFRLSAFHVHPKTHVELFFALTVISAFGVAAYQISKRDRMMMFCTLFFVLTIWPVLHLIEINDSIIYERFVYLPSVGIYVLFARIFTDWAEDRSTLTAATAQRILLLVFALYILTFSFVTFTRCQVWNNSETLWKDVLKKYPDAAVAYNNLGNYYAESGDVDKALTDFNLAIALAPAYADAYYNKGNMLAKKGSYPGAMEMYSKTLQLDASYSGAYNNRGNMYLLTGRYDKALKDYDAVIGLNPLVAAGYLNRASGRLISGDYRGALEDFEKVLQLEPGNRAALNGRRKIQQKLTTVISSENSSGEVPQEKKP